MGHFLGRYVGLERLAERPNTGFDTCASCSDLLPSLVYELSTKSHLRKDDSLSSKLFAQPLPVARSRLSSSPSSLVNPEDCRQ